MSLTLESPLWFALAGLIAVAAVVLAWRGRGSWRWFEPACAAAAVLLAAAVGGVGVRWPAPTVVAVLVDVSPSAAPAAFRQPGAVEAALDRLLEPSTRRQVVYFADGAIDTDATAADATRTTLPHPGLADAVLLFSDGQFRLPPGDGATLPPTFPVIDPALRDLADAAVVRMELRGEEVIASVRNSGGPRSLTWSGVSAGPAAVPPGGTSAAAPAPPPGGEVTATLNGGDAFPQNDTMALRAPPPPQAVRRWVAPTGAGAPAGWVATAPEMLQAPADLLDAEAVVLADVPAGAVPPAARAALAAYVRDLGGTLILAGGPDSFAAGGWTGSAIDEISPLAASPPQPRTLWMLLVDASGSMTAPAGDGDGTRWERAIGSMAQAADTLPPNDLVLPGSFARELAWWREGPVAASGAADATRPPANPVPRGPTNLAAALEAIAEAARTSPDGLRRVVLLVTDGEASIDEPARLAESLRSAGITVLALTIDPTSPAGAVDDVVQGTGGRRVAEADARRWADAVATLARSADVNASPRPVGTSVRLAAPLDLEADVRSLNPTWLRAGATMLGRAPGAEGGETPAAAAWQAGTGRVVALAFPDDAAAVATAAAAAYGRPPDDPRFRLRWIEGPTGRLEVRAREVEGDFAPLNELALTWAASGGGGGAGTSGAFRQVAPGTYEAEVPHLPDAEVLIVHSGGRTIARLALPRRYAEEFAATGLNRAALEALAESTGGRMVEPDAAAPIDLPRRSRTSSLFPHLCVAAAGVVLLGLILDARRARRS